MTINRQPIYRCFFHIIIFMMTFILPSTELMAADPSETHKDGVRFELRLASMEKVDAVVFGHTHQPYVKMKNGVLLFNPGAALPVRGQHPSVGILDIGERTITGRIVYL